MEKKNIDWSKLGFAYTKTDYRWQSTWDNGEWSEGGLLEDPEFHLLESACVFHYSQSCFEGLKAYTTEDGRIVTFRPDQNGLRMIDSAKRLEIPPFPLEKFLQSIDEVVRANAAWVPPYGTGASLYIRPVLFGSGPQIGVAPAPSYTYRVFVMPVGSYFKEGPKPIRICVSDYDRAAPHGTGAIKAGLNYAMSLFPTQEAHRNGYAENMYLDPQTRTYVEETGGANILFVDADNNLIVPKSQSILPSVTRRSLVYVGQHYLGLNVIERQVRLDEVKNFKECCLCGTAAVLAPVGLIHTHEGDIALPSGMDQMGEICGKLRQTLTDIQACKIEAPEGWIRTIC
ncbi:branched-chain amino acid aminotransferase [Sutterella sp.]|uniref:branched-chain amino acid aminotransferase n=1 Tax=Sutterella sp. TaxID=1981025 RepID=UPI0026E0F42C|nr:branched-chain amino acid aminotransferase [Sutterella sp.]MDO5531463.1 branched-chain amino acid aminotransferase [Sutterella sp.]